MADTCKLLLTDFCNMPLKIDKNTVPLSSSKLQTWLGPILAMGMTVTMAYEHHASLSHCPPLPLRSGEACQALSVIYVEQTNSETEVRKSS